MKVLMVNDNDPDAVVGGSEHYIADLTHALEADGHDVHWFALSEDPARVASGRSRKCVFRIRATTRWVAIRRRVIFFRDLHRELADYVARLRPDVIHLHNNHRYPVSVLAAARGHRIVQTVHDYCAMYPTANCSRRRSCAGRSVFVALGHGCLTWKLLATEFLLLYGRRFLDRRFVDAFIAPSRDLALHLDRMGYARVRHVPNFRLLPESGTTPLPDAQVVLYAGALIAHKGVAMLLDAFAGLVGDVPQAALWLVGNGPDAADLESSVRARGLRGVRFLGQRSPDELADLYRRARVVVIPSLWLENAPLVAIEAAAYGRAVIASRVGGLPELVEHGKTGFLFDRGDRAGLADRLRLLLTDRSLAETLGAAGREQSAKRLSPIRHLDRILAVYGASH
ncbi:MAG: glycosyltransferase family 4 protein [Gammaproteobacteria bacterium]|nr:glycosyltransferase family 4 protein [Gammaproteobacteria bacterium]